MIDPQPTAADREAAQKCWLEGWAAIPQRLTLAFARHAAQAREDALKEVLKTLESLEEGYTDSWLAGNQDAISAIQDLI